MKKLLSGLAILLILSCNNSNTSKEKFQYERVKEDNVSTQNNSVSNNVILNSNDQMKFDKRIIRVNANESVCLLYTSPSPRDQRGSRMPSSA